MTDPNTLGPGLQRLWHEHFPLSKTMQIQVQSYADHTLTTVTSLAPNINIHNTAFAGSLYAIESLTAWGVLYLELQVAGFDASIIHASGNIHFDRTVTTDIVATASFAGSEQFFEELSVSGKARLNLTAEVFPTDAADEDEPASHFEGLYVVRLNR